MKRNKKLTLLILLALMMVLCLCLFTACQNEKWDLNEHPNTPPELDLVGKGVELLYKWIGSYGWTVVVFTVLLKLIMTPLDFWQRFSAKKQAVKTQEMQPIIESIDKRYGANSQKGNEEKQKLYKKQGVSMFSTCLPLIASMVIFFIMWGGLNSYSSRINVQNYLDLHDAYVTEYDRVASEHKGEPIEDYNQEAITKAKDAVVKRYNTDVQQGWLWIKNVWRPDTWEKVMLDYTAFTNGSMGTVGVILDSKDGEAIYKNIYDAVISDYDGWNGYMILPILSVALSFFSMWLTQRMDKKKVDGKVVKDTSQNAASNKMMMIIMPLMMAYFGFIYTGAFAIYMVFSSLIGLLTTVALKKPIDIAVAKSIAKSAQSQPKASYKR